MPDMPALPSNRTEVGLADRVAASEPRCGAVRLVCIDGPAGSGKTTLADALAAELGRRSIPHGLVHLDDLYEGWRQDLGAPLAARIEAWLLVPWRDGLPGRHPRYDWGLARYVEWVEVAADPVVILEGCGSASRAIRARASVVVWVEAEAAERLARGLDRDGPALKGAWHRWQAAEHQHFEDDGTRAAADVVVRDLTAASPA